MATRQSNNSSQLRSEHSVTRRRISRHFSGLTRAGHLWRHREASAFPPILILALFDAFYHGITTDFHTCRQHYQMRSLTMPASLYNLASHAARRNFFEEDFGVRLFTFRLPRSERHGKNDGG